MPVIRQGEEHFDITWSPLDYAFNLGRNGYMQSGGIAVSVHRWTTGHLTLQPITSRGDFGRARIVVPTAEIPALIEQLQRICAAVEPPTIPASAPGAAVRSEDCSLSFEQEG